MRQKHSLGFKSETHMIDKSVVRCCVKWRTPELLLTEPQAQETWLLAPSTDRAAAPTDTEVGKGAKTRHLIKYCSFF